MTTACNDLISVDTEAGHFLGERAMVYIYIHIKLGAVLAFIFPHLPVYNTNDPNGFVCARACTHTCTPIRVCHGKNMEFRGKLLRFSSPPVGPSD